MWLVIIIDIQDAGFGVFGLVENNCVHFDGDIVFGEALLKRHNIRDDPQVDLVQHACEYGNVEVQARLYHSVKLAEEE